MCTCVCVYVSIACTYVHIYRINQWKDTSALWLHGYWQYDWADNYVKVLSIDHSSSEITIEPKTPTLYSMLSSINHAKIFEGFMILSSILYSLASYKNSIDIYDDLDLQNLDICSANRHFLQKTYMYIYIKFC